MGKLVAGFFLVRASTFRGRWILFRRAKTSRRMDGGQVLRDFGSTVFDPRNKPKVCAVHEYRQEGVDTAAARDAWTFEDSPDFVRND